MVELENSAISTSCLQSRRSSSELQPHMVDLAGNDPASIKLPNRHIRLYSVYSKQTKLCKSKFRSADRVCIHHTFSAFYAPYHLRKNSLPLSFSHIWNENLFCFLCRDKDRSYNKSLSLFFSIYRSSNYLRVKCE